MSTESPAPGRRISPRVALVVDDDPGMRKLVKDLLVWEGIDTHELSDGDCLVREVEEEKVSLVVLDKEMPSVSGLDLVPYLSRRWPQVPVIVITAFGGPAARAEAMARGATVYLDKPFRVGDFLRAVRQALGAEPGPAVPQVNRRT